MTIDNGTMEAKSSSTHSSSRVVPINTNDGSGSTITIIGGEFSGIRVGSSGSANAVRMGNNTYYISGGTFTATGGSSQTLFDKMTGSLNIAGGTFKCDGNLVNANTAVISGGTFLKASSQTAMNVESHLAAGYLQQADGSVKSEQPEEIGPVSSLEPVSPSGTIDTVAGDVRTYLSQASELYDNADPVDYESMTSPKVKGQNLYESKTPVVFKWGWDSTGTVPADAVFSIQLSLTSDFENCRTIPCTLDTESQVQTTEVWNLMTAVTYYWRVTAKLSDGSTVAGETMTFATMAGPNLITIDGVTNARDLGGWTTTDGKRILQARFTAAPC